MHAAVESQGVVKIKQLVVLGLNLSFETSQGLDLGSDKLSNVKRIHDRSHPLQEANTSGIPSWPVAGFQGKLQIRTQR